METEIIKHEGNKIQVVENNEIKEYELEEWVKPEFVKLGDADITIKDGKVAFVSMKKTEKPVEKKTEKTSEGKSWADDMTNYEDLLTAAHELAKKDGLILNIESRPQKDAAGNPMVNFEKRTALYEATLTITDQKGQVMQKIVDTGDAEGITNENIKPHFNRMASTRAMARCYRIYTNNAKVAIEETTN